VNLSLPGVVMFVGGAILMYSAVKNRDPRDVVLTALGQKPRFGEIAPGDALGKAFGNAAPKAVTTTAPPAINNPVWV
jgi:hypothetical protein